MIRVFIVFSLAPAARAEKTGDLGFGGRVSGVLPYERR
jgi:hypothetical protein